MKKIIYLFIIFSHFMSYGQNRLEGRINYEQIVLKKKVLAELLFTKDKFIYIYNRKLPNDTLKNIETNHFESNIELPDKTDEFGEICFQDISINLLKCRELVGGHKYFFYDESIPHINWKLSKEKKKIGKFNCQKATTTFRGRNYEAWFTTEIPISAGPWKLHGLPGLILEAYDDKNQVQFIFKEIQIPENIAQRLLFPKNAPGKKITFEEHKTIEQKTAEHEKEMMLIDLPKDVTVSITINTDGIIEKSYEK